MRQVHLIHAELFDEMAEYGFALKPGDLGENITTKGLDLLGMSRGTRLKIGADVVLSVTGLRNPCAQIDTFAPGLLNLLAFKTSEGIVRKAGIMAVVETSGTVLPGDPIAVERPEGPHIALDRV